MACIVRVAVSVSLPGIPTMWMWTMLPKFRSVICLHLQASVVIRVHQCSTLSTAPLSAGYLTPFSARICSTKTCMRQWTHFDTEDGSSLYLRNVGYISYIHTVQGLKSRFITTMDHFDIENQFVSLGHKLVLSEYSRLCLISQVPLLEDIWQVQV